MIAKLLLWLLSHSTQAGATALDYQSDVTNEPLTEQELKLMHRLLSDTSLFPRNFKQWVTDHSSDTVDISKSQVHGLINSEGTLIFTNASWEQLGAALCPMIVPYPATVAPANWLFCDGAAYDRVEYANLFNFLGTGFNKVTTPGTQFRVPDIQGRDIYGMDPTGTAYQMLFAADEGAQPGGRGPWHHHTVPDHQHPMAHQHGLSYGYFNSGGAGAVTGGGADTYTGGSTQTATGYGGAGVTSGAGRPDTGGWIALNYIIAAGKVNA
jgi:microcystin-dependent protein